MRGRDPERRAVVVGAVVQPGQPGTGRVHHARRVDRAVGAEDRLRRLDLQLQVEGDAVRRLQGVEDREEGAHLLDVGHLRQRDDGPSGTRPAWTGFGTESPEEQVQAADAAAAGGPSSDLAGCRPTAVRRRPTGRPPASRRRAARRRPRRRPFRGSRPRRRPAGPRPAPRPVWPARAAAPAPSAPGPGRGRAGRARRGRPARRPPRRPPAPGRRRRRARSRCAPAAGSTARPDRRPAGRRRPARAGGPARRGPPRPGPHYSTPDSFRSSVDAVSRLRGHSAPRSLALLRCSINVR